DLDEDVYMHVLQGAPCSKPNQVCKLLKSLYGLGQASRMWYEKLTTSFYLKLGYTQSNADYLCSLLKGDEHISLLV
nr:retrotransposon peptide {Ty1-copia retrotransposon element, clone Sat 8} [Vicia sativa, leaves, Peptide Transposon Partial, 75 aa] [Vicia sativa]